jgi:hypothetical protein
MGYGVLALLVDIIGSYWFRAGFLTEGSENKSWILIMSLVLALTSN